MGKGFNGVENLFTDEVTTPGSGGTKGFIRPERVLTMIRIDSIVDHSPNQKRVITFDPDNIPEDQELLSSVKRYGVLEPIIVKKHPGQLGSAIKHLLVAGHRRTGAAGLAGYEYIPALIAKEEDDVSIITLVENTGVRKLSSYELAISLEQISNEHPEWDTYTIIEKTGIPQSTVYISLKVIKDSCSALLGLCERGMGSRTIIELQKIFAKINAEEKQFEFAEKIENNITHKKVEEIRSMVDSGIDPFVAFSMTVSNDTSSAQIKSDDIVEDDGISPATEERSNKRNFAKGNEKGESKSSGTTNTESNANLLPDVDDNKALSSISLITGLSFQRTKSLLKLAIEDNLTMKEFSLACKFVNAGGDKNKVFQIAKSAQANKKVNDLLMAHQKMCAQANRIWDDESIEESLRILVINTVFGKREA